ncbi:MAG TPA: pteridine reductase [Steroidobacteraceae bacterium]|jgi:pteridine reductase|nr:pteridine reductase [Steroidobacteraceae bacterium]
MPKDLHGKTVLITGGARRVGAVIARRLHEAGANLAIHYRSSASEAQALCAELNSRRGDSAVTLQADLLDTALLPGLVNATLTAFGSLDVLINNASSFYATPVGEITPAQWEDLVGTNLRAPLFLSQAAAPQLRERQGLIINIVDVHGQRPLKRFPVYSAAKAGLIMLTQSLARELAPAVRVNAIAPGPVLFPEEGMTPEIEAKIVERTLLKRRGTPDDIASAALFLAADAPYVTGQVLVVDGGRSINA